jgi:hypothetical protein
VIAQPLLPQSTCGPDSRCVPCYDPTAADPNEPTGACGLSCDAPARPPTILECPWEGPAVIDPEKLPACEPQCSGARCLPAELVPADQAGLLATCPGGYCTPNAFIESAGYGLPRSCTAFADTEAEGRCLSTCLPIVAEQATLERGLCFLDERCVPCYDPLSGEDTGACRLACDVPAQPPYQFPGCCVRGGQTFGRCVVRSQIPNEDEGRLTVDECPPSDMLCVPVAFLPGGQQQACSAWYGSGSCVPSCINTEWYEDILFLFLSQGNCPSGHYCVP